MTSSKQKQKIRAPPFGRAVHVKISNVVLLRPYKGHVNRNCYGLTIVKDRLEGEVAALGVKRKFVNMHLAGA